MTYKPQYKRVLLKLSGEILMGSQSFGIQQAACQKIALPLKQMKEEGLEVAVVIGGGNILRGKTADMPRTPADQMGMLSTLINGVALQQALESIHCKAKLMTALECPRVAESYQWGKAVEYLSKGDLLIFVGGTGNPYFTTDTAAALRACEIEADILLKATKVDGVYDKDPHKHTEAKKYEKMTYSQVLAENLQVMDATSIALCMSHQLPILVFNMKLLTEGKIMELLADHKIGTLVAD